MSTREEAAQRRNAIADAAIEIIAAQGMRALTHRAVDARLALPSGSTSYYVRTRRDLIEAVIHRLAERTRQDVTQAPAREPATAAEGAVIMAGVVDGLAGARSVDQTVRFALILELAADPELHALITDRSPVRATLLEGAERLLGNMGVPQPHVHAAAVIAVADGLVFDRIAGSGRAVVDARPVFEAYFAGLGARTSVPSERR
jgi:AcrR family transcriptional regulator